VAIYNIELLTIIWLIITNQVDTGAVASWLWRPLFSGPGSPVHGRFSMGELVVTKDVAQLYLLVLSRKWMRMGEWHGIINGYCGSFPHSLLSTSKFKTKTVQWCFYVDLIAKQCLSLFACNMERQRPIHRWDGLKWTLWQRLNIAELLAVYCWAMTISKICLPMVHICLNRWRRDQYRPGQTIIPDDLTRRQWGKNWTSWNIMEPAGGHASCLPWYLYCLCLTDKCCIMKVNLDMYDHICMIYVHSGHAHTHVYIYYIYTIYIYHIHMYIHMGQHGRMEDMWPGFTQAVEAHRTMEAMREWLRYYARI
jgi:hypothetical protein